MTQEKIFSELKTKSFYIIHMGKDFVFVSREDFESFEKYFQVSQIKVFFRSGVHLRTKERLSHLHAVKYENFVQVHEDYGNFDRNIFLGIIHSIIDVLPYFYFKLFRIDTLKEKITELEQK